MKRLIAFAAVVAAASSAVAGTVTPPTQVKFADGGAVEQSLTGQAGNPADGMKVATTKSLGNCVACHVAKGWAKLPLPGNIGPDLTGVATRYDEAQLRGILVNSKHTFPDSMMPSFYNTSNIIRPGDGYTGKAAKEVTTILSAQQVEDVVSFLMTFKG